MNYCWSYRKTGRYPIILWHGAGLDGSAWETTPDGREGYQSIFLRKGYSVYIIDQPRQARAGQASVGSVALADPTPIDSVFFNIFRFGNWTPPAAPQFFPGVQFPEDAQSLNQFYRRGVLHGTGGNRDDWTGTGDAYQLMTGAVGTLADDIGPAVLVTHSGGANQGWGAAMKSNSTVKAIYAYEPTNFQFPDGELPAVTGPLQVSHTVPLSDFLKLTTIPIQLVYGDNLNQVPLFTQAFRDAQAFVAAINRHGGQAQLLHLPDIGITGNTHFAFSDLNNVQIANLLSQFLTQHHLN